MQSPTSKTAEFRCGLAGVVSKQAPDLLRDGQYRYLMNIQSNQEGSISNRTGVKQVGVMTTAEPTCYFVRKLCVQTGENPSTPSTNPRYLGILTSGAQRNIYRSLDYNSKTLVASGVDSSPSRHWEMADFAAGDSGSAWAYFACPNAMLKDSGANPYGTLPRWGIQAAPGVCLAAVITGSVSVSDVSISLGTWDGVVVTLGAAVGLSDFDTLTISGSSGIAVTTTDGRTSLNDTWDIRVGVPDSSGAIVNATTQFRLFDHNGQAVQGTGSYGGGGTATGVPVAGNLDGGAESSPNNTQPYDWSTSWEETDTADFGNPSQLMATAGTATLSDGGINYVTPPLAIHGGQAKVAIWGTSDARIGFIRVYRRGGALTDEVGRLVARVSVSDPSWVTTGGGEKYFILTDNTADADLVFKDQWQTDNDPPVTSTPKTPIRSAPSGSISAGWQTVGLTSSVFGPVTPGSLVHIIDTSGTDEDVYVESVPSTSSFRAYFQFAHGSGASIEVDAISGQPCFGAVTIGESVVVFGDPNNPHILYKSKNGFPQAFPVGTDAAGAITSIAAGTPANGIINATECRGQIVTMNVSSLFAVAVLNGSLTTPYKIAGKGLRAQSAWCKTDTEEIWLLSDDGIYSWDGGFFRKRSEAIDQIFHGQQENNIQPLDTTPSSLSSARMEFHRGIIRLAYVDIGGHTREVTCEPMYGDRWAPLNEEVYETSLPEFPTTMLFEEPDTKSLIVVVNNPNLGAQFGIADTTVVSGGVNLTSDWWISSVTAGNPIPWEVRLPWFDMGNPVGEKLYEEVFLDIDPQLYTGVYSFDSSVSVDLLLDFSDTAVETFTLTIPSGSSLTGRTLMSLLPRLISGGGTNQSYGREARAISFRLYGSAYPVQFSLYRLFIQYQETGQLSAGANSDWMDLGSKNDKRLYQMAVEFETAGVDRQIVLETMGGRDGTTAGTPQVFTLSNPTSLGSGRFVKLFPVADRTVAKLVRVRPYTSAVAGGTLASSVDLFRIYSADFPYREEYPADVVTVTPWDDGGYEYDKYCNQTDYEVNTNGVPIIVQLQADGANVGPTFTITSTESDRRRNITMPAGLVGKKWRTFVDPTQPSIAAGAGMWQLFGQSFKFQKADPGEVVHTADWDDLGHPWDKYLKTVTLEWDDTGGANVTLQMDTLTGINGNFVSTNVQSFPLFGGRSQKPFAFPADTIVKKIRIYPAGTTIPTGFKGWKYKVDFDPYPADVIRSTAWRDAGTGDDKNPSWVWLDMDTAAVSAIVGLNNELGPVVSMPINHTGTVTNRKANYAVPVDIYGKMWRLLLNPGANGKTQLFDWGFARWHPFELGGGEDPPEVVLWTPWNDFGWPYEKLARNLNLTIDTGGVPCQVALQTQEGGTVQTFPVTTTYTTRRVVLACTAGLDGTLWRLVLTPGVSGKAKLWNWGLEHVKEPPALTSWSSFQQSFGFVGWKFIKEVWLEYVCAQPVQFQLTSDTGGFSVTMPAHATRSVDRFYPTTVWGSGFNKSRLYTVSFSSAAPVKMYADCSGIRWLPSHGDRAGNYQKTAMSEFMQLAI